MDSDKEYFYAHFMDSSWSNEHEDSDEITIMKEILEDVVHAEEHVVN